MEICVQLNLRVWERDTLGTILRLGLRDTDHDNNCDPARYLRSTFPRKHERDVNFRDLGLGEYKYVTDGRSCNYSLRAKEKERIKNEIPSKSGQFRVNQWGDRITKGSNTQTSFGWFWTGLHDRGSLSQQDLPEITVWGYHHQGNRTGDSWKRRGKQRGGLHI